MVPFLIDPVQHPPLIGPGIQQFGSSTLSSRIFTGAIAQNGQDPVLLRRVGVVVCKGPIVRCGIYDDVVSTVRNSINSCYIKIGGGTG